MARLKGIAECLHGVCFLENNYLRLLESKYSNKGRSYSFKKLEDHFLIKNDNGKAPQGDKIRRTAYFPLVFTLQLL